MKFLELLIIFIQSVLLILQFFGAFGSIYYLVYVILFFIDDNQNQSFNYTDKDLIILFFIFMISLISNLIGILGNFKKSKFYLCVYEVFTALVTVIFFTGGLLICGVWSAIALFVSLIMIGILLKNPSVLLKPTKPVTTGQSAVQNYSYLDNNPPDYNSLDFNKPIAPPQYHSVELMPVQSMNTTYNNLQKY